MVKEKTVEAYLCELKSDSPTPGGGSASALQGAIGSSLALMVIRLTVGKKAYRNVSEKLYEIGLLFESLREEFLSLSDRDEEAYAFFRQALALPKETDDEIEERRKAIAEASIKATEVPMTVMRTALRALNLLREVAPIGSKHVISDAGVSCETLLSALSGASMNVRINAKYMNDAAVKEAFLKEMEEMLKNGQRLHDEIESITIERIS